MDKAFVVVDGSDAETELVREAGELAAGVGASLVVCSVIDQDDLDEYDETIEAIERSERTSYGVEARENVASQRARDVSNDVLDDVDVEYETAGLVAEDGDRANKIVDLATELDCDHVFIVGRRRSPTGKAVFGDTAQRVILNFDGAVTVIAS